MIVDFDGGTISLDLLDHELSGITEDTFPLSHAHIWEPVARSKMLIQAGLLDALPAGSAAHEKAYSDYIVLETLVARLGHVMLVTGSPIC